ncbi:unnamed protein product [Effrenium voratum]|nr:unnamed protein product [Effrenium voratum]
MISRRSSLMMALAVSAPGVCCPPPQHLAWAMLCLGLAATLTTSLIAVSAIVPGLTEVPALAAVSLWPKSLRGLLNCFAVMLAQFSAQSGFEATAASDDAEELGGRGPANSGNAFAIAAGLSSALALGGYLHFGENVHSNVLLSWAAVPSKTWLQVVQLAYLVPLAAGAALASKPCVVCIQEIFASRRGSGAGHSERLALLVLMCCGVLTWALQDLGHALRFLGAFGASPLVLMLPPLFYVEMARRQSGRTMLCAENGLALMPAVLGILLTVLCFFDVLQSSMSSPPGHRGERATVALPNLTWHCLEWTPGLAWHNADGTFKVKLENGHVLERIRRRSLKGPGLGLLVENGPRFVAACATLPSYARREAAKEADIQVANVHAGVSFSERIEGLKKFGLGEVPAMICTDLGARGLDLPICHHVIQLEFAGNTISYLHRVGRATRAANKSQVTNFWGAPDIPVKDLIMKAPDMGLSGDVVSRRGNRCRFSRIRKRQRRNEFVFKRTREAAREARRRTQNKQSDWVASQDVVRSVGS